MKPFFLASFIATLVCGNVMADTLHFVNGAELVVHDGVLVEVHLNGATEISFSDGVKSIGNDAFRGCYGLRSVTILYGVTSIGDRAFYGCDSLTSVTLPDSMTSIGREAFRDCRSLTNISIPGSITYIGENAFDGCGFCYGTSNVSWTIRNGELTDVELNGKTDITIPSSVTRIGNNAFRYCHELSSVIIPDSVTSIGRGAFADCRELTSVIMGNGITRIESGAFDYCNSLSIVMFLGTLPDCANGAFGLVANGCVAYVDASVTSLQDGDIWNNMTVRKIPLPRDADSLSRVTFTIDHDELTHVTLNGATVVMIPGSVTRIRYDAFDDCRDMTSMLIPSSVTRIDGAFRNCYNLTNVVVLASSTGMNEPRIEDYMFEGCDKLASVTIGHGITSIGDRAFEYCRELTNVSIPDSVTSIGRGAFADCRELTSVTIPASVTSIGAMAFNGCQELANIVFKGNAPRVSSQTFSGVTSSCTALVSPSSTGWDVEIPGTWNGMRIEYYVFQPLADVATAAEVAEALSGVADASLVTNIANGTNYNAFCAWAQSVKDSSGAVPIGAQTVKESAHAWLSYALGADIIIEKELTSDDVKIESFVPASTDGKFEFTVNVKDVNIGGGSVAVETLKENLKKVLGIEGSATLSPGGFSSDNIDITFDTPVDGKARFTVSPPADAGNSFFMRVRVK